VFAIPEIVELLRANQAIAGDAPLGKGWRQGLRDWANNWGLSLRTSAIGCIVGVIPGLGGSVVDWIAYGHAVQTAKDTSQFGKGDIRGVIAPDSANNSMQGGAMMPTILFGIPGSGSMAVFLGALALLGIEPGPSMVTTDLHLTYAMIWSQALANVFGAGICALLARPIAGLTKIPFQLMAPFLIVMISFAAFQATRDLADLVGLLLLGTLGIFMKRFGWPRPALLIGFVLAPQAETYLYQAVQFDGWAFLIKPGVLIIAAIIAVSVYFGLRNRVDEAQLPAEAAADVAGAKNASDHRMPQLAFAVFGLGVLVIGFLDSIKHSFLGAVFPMGMSIVGILFGLLLLYRLWSAGPGDAALYDAERQPGADGLHLTGGSWNGPLWIAGLVGLSALLGFLLAVAIFFPAFMYVRARQTAFWSLVYTAWALAGILGMAYALALNFPSGVLQTMVELPWPLR